MPHTPVVIDPDGEHAGSVPPKPRPAAGSPTVRSWSGAPPAPEQDPLLGQTLNSTYVIERAVGEGGMGRVYEARHTRIAGKRFAVKVLHAEYMRQEQVRTRFYREAEAAALISDPHVVGVYDMGETDDGQPYLVAEFLEGRELGEYLEELGRLPVGATIRVVRQVCQALAAAHARGVIHRDVKPENVFLTGDPAAPMVKVLDFGISRLEDKSGATLTKTGMIMGTPAYMSPEQARGERVDQRADLYAAGAILYRCLTGVLPFDKDDPGATVVAVLTEQPQRPRAINEGIPEPLELVIQKAMAKKPDDRFQTMAELDAALAPFDDEPALAGSDAAGAAHLSPFPGVVALGGRAGGPAATAKTALGQQTAALRMARPMLALLLSLAGIACVGALVGAICAIIRLVRGGVTGQVTGLEAGLVLLAVVFTVATPGWLLVRHLRSTVWDNTAKVVELVEQVARPLLVGAATYGLVALLVRLAEIALLGQAVGTAWAGWDLLLLLFGLGGAVSVVVAPRLERRQASASASDRMAMILLGMAVAVVLVLGALAIRGKVAATDLASPASSTSAAASASAGPSAGGTASGTGARPVASPGGDALDDLSQGLEQRKLVSEFQKQIGRGELQEAIASLERLLELNPKITSDGEARSGIMTLAIRASMLPDRPEVGKIFELLATRMGPGGLDILYELVTTRGGTEASKHAQQLLANDKIRAQASPGLQVAWDLRNAKSCDAFIALFDRARSDGDRRAVKELQDVKNCRNRSPKACCLRDDERLKELIATIEAGR